MTSECASAVVSAASSPTSAAADWSRAATACATEATAALGALGLSGRAVAKASDDDDKDVDANRDDDEARKIRKKKKKSKNGTDEGAGEPPPPSELGETSAAAAGAKKKMSAKKKAKTVADGKVKRKSHHNHRKKKTKSHSHSGGGEDVNSGDGEEKASAKKGKKAHSRTSHTRGGERNEDMAATQEQAKKKKKKKKKKKHKKPTAEAPSSSSGGGATSSVAAAGTLNDGGSSAAAGPEEKEQVVARFLRGERNERQMVLHVSSSSAKKHGGGNVGGIGSDGQPLSAPPATLTPTKPMKRLDKYGFIVNLDERHSTSHHGPRPSETFHSGVDAKGNGGSGGGGDGRGGGTPSPKKKRTAFLKKTPSDRSKQLLRERQRIEARREKKWLAMMDDWTTTTTRRKATLKRRVRKGVPDSIRGEAWAVMGNVPNRIEFEHPGLYDELVQRTTGGGGGASGGTPSSASFGNRSSHNHNSGAGAGGQQARGDSSSASNGNDAEGGDNGDRPPPYCSVTRETIERDINRTFPRHHMFYDGSDAESDDGGGDCGDGASAESRSSDDAPSCAADPEAVPAWAMDESGVDSSADGEDGAATGAGVQTTTAIEGGGAGRQVVNLASKFLSNVPDAMQCATGGLGNVVLDGMPGVRPSATDPAGGAATDDLATDALQMQRSATATTTATFLSATPRASAAAAEEIERVAGGAAAAGGAATSERKQRKKTKEKAVDFAVAKGGQASLRRVLRAYSVYDQEVGYCQGMNFIAAMFITFMAEEKAFWMLVAVMNDPPCKMRGLFGEGMSEAHQVLFIAEKLIGQFLPKLSKHLERESIHITMFATQWLLTLYTSSFPFDLVTRVWDCFLAEGWKIVYRVMLALLDRASPDLMKLTFEDILAYIRDLPSTVQASAIMDEALKIPLRRRHIERYAAQYAASTAS